MNRSLLAVASSIAVCTGHALAETYWVTSLADSGTGSLRTAIGQANSHLGPDEVVFHPSLSGILDLSTEIFVTSPLTIVGPPSRAVTIRSAGGIFRLDASVIESATEFGMFDLTMTAASAVIYRGIPVRVDIHRCVFRDSNAAFGLAAGVFNSSYIVPPRMRGTIASCSFIANSGFRAGVLMNSTADTGEPLRFVNCTFANNSSSSGAGIAQISGTATPGASGTEFVSCTITNNAGGTGGHPTGLIHFAYEIGAETAVRVKNSVIYGNTAGAPVSNPNFTGWGTPGTVELIGANLFTDPQLGPIERIGGVYVRRPLPSSPCIDSAAADPEVLVDQVGQFRPHVRPGTILAPGCDGSDIGAIEYDFTDDCPADFNRSGGLTVQDIFDFLAAYFAGCP